MMIQKFKTLSLFIIFAFAIVISTSGVVIAIGADLAQTGGQHHERLFQQVQATPP
jgi:hypothetical protein